MSFKVGYLAPLVADYRLDTLVRVAESLKGLAKFDVVSLGNAAIPSTPSDNVSFVKITDGFRFSRESGGEKTFDLNVNLQLVRHLHRTKYNVLIVEGFARWALYAQASKILWGSNLLTSYERTIWTERHNSKTRNGFYKLASKNSDSFIVNGQLSKKALADVLGREVPVASPNYTCHSDFFSNKRLKSYKPKQDSQNCVCFVAAKLIPRKGLVELIGALASYPQRDRISLRIAGNGYLQRKLESLISSSGLSGQVRLLGSLPREEVKAELANCDWAVLPTLEDNWSLSMVEAAAMGCPVVTTVYNGLSGEIVKDGVNGLVFDILDLSKTHSMFDSLLGTFSRLSEFGAASSRIMNFYHPDEVAKQFHNQIIQLLPTQAHNK